MMRCDAKPSQHVLGIALLVLAACSWADATGALEVRVAEKAYLASDAADFVLWSFIEDPKLYPLCQAVMTDIGHDRTSDPNLAASSCEKETVKVSQTPGSEVKKHCEYFAVQLEQYTVQGMYSTKDAWCGNLLQFHSFKLKHDLLNYLGRSGRWNACSDSVNLAIEQAAGATSKYAAVQSNIAIACKIELEKKFKDNGLPFQVATIGCKHFVAKAQKALAGNELDPEDNGKQFCDGKSMQTQPFAKSAPSPMPSGFPLIKGTRMPTVTLANLARLIRKAFETPRDAFNKYDKSGDGVLDEEEWSQLCRDLGIPKWDCARLRKEVDGDGDGNVTPAEWDRALGVTLEELATYIQKEYGNADKGWKGAQATGDQRTKDERLTPEEFDAHCESVGVNAYNARELFPQVDKNKDGMISEEEYKNVFGINLEELKRRVRNKWGSPEKSFKAIDKDGDGEMSREEFFAACDELDIPRARAEELFGEMDIDGNSGISPDEWDEAMGLDKEDVTRKVMEKLGKPSEAFKKLDADGDGKVTAKEIEEALKDAGMSEEEAKEIAKTMDEDGKGLDQDEYMEKSGAKDLGEDRYATSKSKPKHTTKVAEDFPSPKDAFDAMDADGDGKISPEEWRKSFEKMGLGPEEAMRAFEDLDIDGDGLVSRDEFYGGFGSDSSGDGFREPEPEPIKPLEPDITMEEFKARVAGSSKNGLDAWEKLAGKKGHATPEEFKKFAADLGIPPGQAEKLYNEMDADGDGRVSKEEFQNALGVTEEELKDRALEKWGNADEVLKQTDADGDGQVSKKELMDMMKELGITPQNAEKLANEMFQKYDPDSDGKLTGQKFKEIMRASAEDLADRLQEKLGSATDAFDKWDTDGSGELTEEEFLKGSEDMGISKEAAEEIWKEKAGDKGTLSKEDFTDVFGVGPDQLLERCFENLGNPEDAFQQLDADGDMLVSEDEWKALAGKLGLSPEQAETLWGKLDTNKGEHTEGYVSMWEFFKFMDYDPPKKITWADGYGDLDPFGREHKKFNKLWHDPRYGTLNPVGEQSKLVATTDNTATAAAALSPADVKDAMVRSHAEREVGSEEASKSFSAPASAKLVVTSTAQPPEAAPPHAKAETRLEVQPKLDAKDAEIARLKAEVEGLKDEKIAKLKVEVDRLQAAKNSTGIAASTQLADKIARPAIVESKAQPLDRLGAAKDNTTYHLKVAHSARAYPDPTEQRREFATPAKKPILKMDIRQPLVRGGKLHKVVANTKEKEPEDGLEYPGIGMKVKFTSDQNARRRIDPVEAGPPKAEETREAARIDAGTAFLRVKRFL